MLSGCRRSRRDTLTSQMVFLRGFSPKGNVNAGKERGLVSFSPESSGKTPNKQSSTTTPKGVEDAP